MRVAIYAMVSTSDKDQNPETQMMPLREFVQAQSWNTFSEYVDHAPANDLAHRTQWRRLQEGDGASERGERQHRAGVQGPVHADQVLAGR